jgi:hypothetical protein
MCHNDLFLGGGSYANIGENQLRVCLWMLHPVSQALTKRIILQVIFNAAPTIL